MMNELTPSQPMVSMTFVSLKQSQFLEMSRLTEIVVTFLTVFEHSFQEKGKVLRIQPMQLHTQQMHQRFLDFLKDHAKDFSQFNMFRSFFKELPLGHYFMIIYGKLTDTAEVMNAFTYLTNYNQERGVATSVDVKYFDVRGALAHYNIGTFGHQRRVIGTWVAKERRSCRFCGQITGKENKFGSIVSFLGTSHSISGALGNQKVVTSDECDSCNARFSEGIEPSLIALLSVFRSLHGLPGKKGAKTIVGQNFRLDPKKGLSFKADKTHEQILQQPDFTTNLKLNQKLVPQDVYRCLVKFVFSVIDRQVLNSFTRTMDWVNGEFDAEVLPRIAVHQGANFFKQEPMLLSYLRKDDSELPRLVGEFHYADSVYVFIVPFADGDEKNCCSKADFQQFWKVINATRSSLKWQFRDFSGVQAKEIAIKLSLKGMKIGENAFVSHPEEPVKEVPR